MADSSIIVPDVSQWLGSRVESLRMNYSLTIAERAAKYYRVEGNPIGFRGFEWQIGILNDLHPRQVIVKRSQVGLTLIMMVKIVLILEQYGLVPFYYQDEFGQYMSLSPTGIYTFENATKVSQFSSDRLKSFINENPILQGMLADGDIDQAMLKKFGNSSLYLGGRRTVEGVTSIPAHIVLADEWDRTSDYSIGEQLESRLKASQMFRAKSQRGMFIKYSTPEAYGVGVNKDYEGSDQMVFQIKCTRCNHWQEMIFPDSIGNYYEKGEEKNIDIFYRCLRCGKPLDFSEIGKWDRSNPGKVQNAEWVPKRLEYYENVTKYNEGTRGYRVPWAYSAPVQEVMRDRDEKSKLYFFHHVLGEGFAEDSSGLIPDTFLSRVTDAYQWGRRVPNTVHVMGIDQGCYATIWAMVPFSREDGRQYGQWVLIYSEYVPDEYAFTTWQIDGQNTIPRKGRLHEIMEEWNIDLAVIDAEPSGNDAHNFSREHEGKVFVNHSTQMKNHDPNIGFTYIDRDSDSDDNDVWVGKVSEDKTSAVDCYFDFVREGNLLVAAGFDEEEFNKYIEHHTAIRRVYEEKAFGQIVAVYKSFGQDHFGMSGKMAYQAAVLYHKVDSAVSHIIIPTGISGWKMSKERR
jgi:hypothetical protein